MVVILALSSAVTVVAAESSPALDMAVEVSSSTALSDMPLILQPGAVVTVSVTIKSNPGFSLASFALKYDPKKLEPVVGTDKKLVWEKSTLFTGGAETVTLKDSGEIKYTVYNTKTNYTCVGTIFKCSFKVLTHGTTELLFDMDGNDTMTTAYQNLSKVNISMNGVNGVTKQTILAHNYAGTPAHIAATCTSHGKNVYTCTTCGQVDSAVDYTDPAKGHTEVAIPSISPTCQTSGLTEGTKCSVCNAVVKAQFTIPAGETYHTAIAVPGTPATCLAGGLTDGSKCSVCDKILIAQAATAIGDHSYGEWVVEVEATSTSAGTRSRTCSVCNDKVTETIPAETGAAMETVMIVLIIVIAVLAVCLIGGGIFLVVFLTKKKVV